MINTLTWARGAVAAAVVAATLVIAPQFEAPTPGSLLQPIGEAANAIRLVQGDTAILWTSLGTPVDHYTIQGWPSSDGDTEIGGGVTVVKVNSGSGSIAVDERPMRLEFALGD